MPDSWKGACYRLGRGGSRKNPASRRCTVCAMAQWSDCYHASRGGPILAGRRQGHVDLASRSGPGEEPVGDEQPRVGLVLSGGGARGACQLGVYERLIQEPRFQGPMVLSGRSAGAINAAFIAAGKSPDEMMRFWEDLADRLPIDVTDSLMNRIALAL